MLKTEERPQVIAELADHLGPTGSVRDFIRAVFGVYQKEMLLQLPTSYTMIADEAQFVVDYCLESRWNFNPSLMELLLVRLVFFGKPNLAPLRDRVHAGIDPNPNAYHTLWVLADQPFIDRKNLRTKLEQLVEKKERPIMRVFGVRGTGKSYTAELLSYVAERARPHVHVASATLAEGNGPSYEVAELAESLAVDFLPTEALPERRNSSYPGALCRWIVRNTLAKPGVWIYLLDGFDQKDVNEETRQLVQMLAQQICTVESSRRLRMILLDYDKPLTGNWRAKTLDDRLPEPPGIQQKDVEDCLTEYNTRMLAEGKPQKAIKPGDLPTLAGALLSRSASDPEQLLRKIYDELVALAQLGG